MMPPHCNFLFGNRRAQCHHTPVIASSSPPSSSFTSSLDSFPEHFSRRVPLNHQMDEQEHHLYRWGSVSNSEQMTGGGRSFSESLDSRNHSSVASTLPFPIRRHIFHQNINPEADRINTQYSNMITDILPEGGFQDHPKFSTQWERLLSYHRGIYSPSTGGMKSEEEIRLAVGEYTDKVNADNPKCACKFIDVELFRCREAHQHRMDPNGATEKCLKWQVEFDRCLWDQEKLNRGISYLEDRRHKKHRPYIGAPDYQLS
eukprot:GHVS01036369.1.p1 GENE.GHVS01036369.1~~GHVS01036369.1.p1  ORF type:complete len:259 (+),score=35.17 GHVS01036369.1:133-909(+)